MSVPTLTIFSPTIEQWGMSFEAFAPWKCLVGDSVAPSVRPNCRVAAAV